MRKTENIINRTGINKTECKKTGHSKENKIPGVKCTPKIELYLSNFKGALHWWNGSLFFLIIILGITLGIFAGCKNIFVPEPPATPEAAGPGGGITVSLRLFTGSARSVMPGMEDLNWEITASQGDITISVANGEYPCFSLSLPVSGTWTFTVRGKNSNNDEIFTGSAKQNIESGSTVSISIPLSPGSGMEDDGATGSLNLTIKPENVFSKSFMLRIDNGVWIVANWQSEVTEDMSVVYSPYSIKENDLSVGQHTLDLYFGGGSKFYFCTVAVNIWPGMTSDQWIKTSGEEYIDNGEFVITEEMVNEFVKTMGSVVFVDENVDANTPGTGSIYAPVKTVSTAVEILRKANPDGNYSGTIMVSGATTITNEVLVQSRETLTIKGTGADASIKNTSGRVFNITGGSVTLGDGITLTGTVTGENARGGAVYVTGGTFIMKNGSKITGSSAKYGGGVYVDDKGTFTMDGGTISENIASGSGASGGGVCISSGTFTMSGGAVISGNTATGSGGGVYIHNGTFTMSGDAVISGNDATSSGGGVYVYETGEFTMEGGTIGEKTVEASGNSSEFGGGVCVYRGDFTMRDGSISGNTATKSGGGVFVQDGTFTMEGGTIGGDDEASANSSESGGGVYVVDGTFTMTGGIISGNTATNGNGGGVYVSSISSTGSFTLDSSSAGSSPVISGNTKKSTSPNNVYLYDGKTLSITGKLQKTVDTGNIGISMAIPQEFTSGWSTSGSTGSTFFFSDNPQYKIAVKMVNGQNELQLINE